ncbi:MAG: tetratricopeptide repeat protein [Nitrospiria bacterium]
MAAILAIAVLIGIGYANSLHGEFHLDDLTFKDDPTLHLTDLSIESIGRAAWHRRPVASLTFALNYYWGEHRVAGYHAMNIAIHAAVAFTLYWMLFLAFRTPRARPLFEGMEVPMALGATLLWAMHPVQTQAVTYIVQRMTSLASLFYLLALIGYLKGRTTEGARRWGWWAAALAAAAAALGSKEIAATLPLAVVLIEICLIGGSVRRGLGPRLAWVAVLAVPVAALAVLAAQHETGGSFWAQLTAHRSSTQWFTVEEHLLTEGRVIVHYLTLLVWPHPSRLTFDYSFSVSHGWVDPPATLIAWIAIAGVIGWAIVAGRRAPLVSFGILWFFLNLATESSLIPLDLAFEHRLYLPSMGAAWLAAVAAAGLVRRGGARVRLRLAIAGLLLTGVWTMWTIERNRVWATEFSLWSDTAAKAPANPRALTLLGVAYTDRGEPDRAFEAYQAAIRANPDFHDAHANLGSALIARGDLDGALAAFTRARALDPKNAQDAYHLGLIHQKSGRLDEARREYDTSLRLDPDDASTHNNLGAVHQAAGRWDAALAEYETAVRLDPALAQAAYGLGQVSQHRGHADEALRAYRRTIEIKPEHLDAHLALAGLYLARGELVGALEWFQAALRLAPANPQGHLQVARLLDRVGRHQEAATAYRRFLDLVPADQAAARAAVHERLRALAAGP